MTPLTHEKQTVTATRSTSEEQKIQSDEVQDERVFDVFTGRRLSRKRGQRG